MLASTMTREGGGAPRERQVFREANEWHQRRRVANQFVVSTLASLIAGVVSAVITATPFLKKVGTGGALAITIAVVAAASAAGLTWTLRQRRQILLESEHNQQVIQLRVVVREHLATIQHERAASEWLAPDASES
jgi:hypothetical protein